MWLVSSSCLLLLSVSSEFLGWIYLLYTEFSYLMVYIHLLSVCGESPMPLFPRILSIPAGCPTSYFLSQLIGYKLSWQMMFINRFFFYSVYALVWGVGEWGRLHVSMHIQRSGGSCMYLCTYRDQEGAFGMAFFYGWSIPLSQGLSLNLELCFLS